MHTIHWRKYAKLIEFDENLDLSFFYEQCKKEFEK